MYAVTATAGAAAGAAATPPPPPAAACCYCCCFLLPQALASGGLQPPRVYGSRRLLHLLAALLLAVRLLVVPRHRVNDSRSAVASKATARQGPRPRRLPVINRSFGPCPFPETCGLR
jgi:hypothetical protein